jgi:hypothetical protein
VQDPRALVKADCLKPNPQMDNNGVPSIEHLTSMLLCTLISSVGRE